MAAWANSMAALGLVGFENQPRAEEEEDTTQVLEQFTERDAFGRLDVENVCVLEAAAWLRGGFSGDAFE